MLYYVLKFFMFFVLRYYFRRTYVSGMEHLCPGKPVILASNHANSFNDAFVLGTMLNRSLNYLARSDVFRTALVRAIFSSFHMMPIYRKQEGKKNLLRNQDTFEQCYRILKKNGLVLIFSEGLCIQEKRLRPLKKGTARIMFGAMEHGIDDLQVVPLGLNYTYPEQFRGEMIISIGQPISASGFVTDYKKNSAKAVNRFNERLTAAISDEMVIIENKEGEALAERLLIIARNTLPKPLWWRWLLRNRNRLLKEQMTVAAVNQVMTGAPQRYRKLKESCKVYFDALKRKHLSDAVVAGQTITTGQFLMWILLLPLMPLAYMFRMPPMWLSKWVTSKMVKSREFYGSVLLSTGFLIYGMLLLAAFFVTASFSGWWWGVLVLIGVPLLSYVSLFWEEAGGIIFYQHHWRTLEESGDDSRQWFVKTREALLDAAGI